MKNPRRFLWILIFIPLTLFSFFAFASGMVWFSPPLSVLQPQFNVVWPTAQTFYLTTGLLLSGCTAAFCVIELTNCFRNLGRYWGHFAAFVLILGGLTASSACIMAGAPKVMSSSRHIPELMDYQRVEIPTPTPCQ